MHMAHRALMTSSLTALWLVSTTAGASDLIVQGESGKTITLTSDAGKCPANLGFSAGGKISTALVANKPYGCWYYGSRAVEIWSMPGVWNTSSEEIDTISKDALMSSLASSNEVVARQNDLFFYSKECDNKDYFLAEEFHYQRGNGLSSANYCWGYYPKVTRRWGPVPRDEVIFYFGESIGARHLYLNSDLEAYADLTKFRIPEPEAPDDVRAMAEFKQSILRIPASNTDAMLADIWGKDYTHVQLFDRKNAECTDVGFYDATWTDRTGDSVHGCWFVLNDQVNSYRVVVIWTINGKKSRTMLRIEELSLTLAWRRKFGDIQTGASALDVIDAIEGRF